jgi:hypothetical protein
MEPFLRRVRAALIPGPGLDRSGKSRISRRREESRNVVLHGEAREVDEESLHEAELRTLPRVLNAAFESGFAANGP